MQRPLTLFAVLAFVTASCAVDRSGALRELAGPNDPAGCTEFKVGYDMTVTDFGAPPETRAPFSAFAQTAGDYVALSTRTLDDVTSACRGIALDLGASEDDRGLRGRTGEEASYAWCNLAVRKLQRELTSTLQPTGRLIYAFAPAQCTVDEPFIARCENACATDSSCEEKGVTARCEPAHASGICPGRCTGACVGSPVAPSMCDGACEGRCEGTCAGECRGMCGSSSMYSGGKCRGTCNGVCDGTCSGRCTGPCRLGKGSSGKCDGPCEGGCTATLKSPRCDADLKAPTCIVGADCEAQCKASGQARASCSPPTVSIGAREDFEGALPILAEMRSLERNLSVLFEVVKGRGPRLEAEMKAAYEAGEHIASANPKPSAKAKACATTVLAAAEQAAQNVHVAIQASKSVLDALQLEQ